MKARKRRTLHFKAINADNPSRYEDGTPRPKRAPLPKSICGLIKQSFITRGERTFAFLFVSHVIASGGAGLAGHKLLRAIQEQSGLPTDDSELAGLAFRCLSLLKRSKYRFGGPKPLARRYSLRPELIGLLGDETLYKTWADFERRKCWKPEPKPFDELVFYAGAKGTLVDCSAEFIAAVRALSLCGFSFDKASALLDDDVMKSEKARSTAIKLPSGLFFTSYKLEATGRLGTYDVHVQGIPRSVRRHIRSTHEGYTLVALDYRTQESRILAYLSGDEKLLEALADGRNLYRDLSELYALPDYDTAKTVINAILYGSDARELAGTIFNTAWADDEQFLHAEQVVEDFWARFPQSKKWIDEKTNTIKEQGFAITCAGTKRCDGLIDEFNGRITTRSAWRKGVNFIIQGTAADILRRLVVNLHADKRLQELGARLLLPLHDCLIVETPVCYRDEVARLVEDLMLSTPREILPGIALPVAVSDM